MATYTSANTGLWSNGATWVGGVSPPISAGHKIVISNTSHIVTLDVSGEWGDDTSSTTVANNAIYINGTLKVNPGVTLISRGTIAFGTSGKLEIGTDAVPIPRSSPVTIVANYSTSLAIGKHIIYSPSSSVDGKYTLVGQDMTRNTSLSANVSAGETSIQVDEASNWLIGDRLILASDTNDCTRVHRCTITSVSGTSIGITPGLNYSRESGCSIGNKSSAITIRSYSSAHGACWRVVWNPANGLGSDFNLKNVAFYDNSNNASGWTGASQVSALYSTALTFQGSVFLTDLTLYKCVFEHSTSGISITNNQVGCLYMSLGTNGRYVVDSCLFDVRNYTGAPAISNGDLSISTIKNSFIPYCNYGWRAYYGYGTADSLLENNTFYAVTAPIGATSGKSVTINNCKLYSNDTIGVLSPIDMAFNNCIFGATNFYKMAGNAGTGTATISNCIFGTTPADWFTGSPIQSNTSLFTIINKDNNPTDNILWNSYQYSSSDLINTYRSSSSMKLNVRYANSDNSKYTWSIPCTNGISQRFIGYLRFNSTYGVTYPPSITITGPGVSSSFTSAVSADMWHKFDLTVNPTNNGDLTLSFIGKSVSTLGYCWLDGLCVYPIIQSARHYGFIPTTYQSPSNVVDPNISVSSEATVLSYTEIDTQAKLYDRLSLWACENQSSSIFYSQTAGILNLGSHNLIVDATAPNVFNISGNNVTVKASILSGTKLTTTGLISFLNGAIADLTSYTHATGTFVKLSFINAQVSGTGTTWTYARNMTDNVDIWSQSTSASSYSTYVQYTADKTVRLRCQFIDGVDANTEFEQFQTLTENGLLFDIRGGTDDLVYIANAVNGPTVLASGEFTADGTNLECDVDDPDNSTDIQRVYAWYKAYLATDPGIKLFWGAITAKDVANLIVNNSIVPMKFDNKKSNLLVIGGGSIINADGSTNLVSSTTTGSIYFHCGNAPVVQVLSQVESSTILAKEATSQIIKTDVQVIKPNTGLIPSLL